MVLLLPAFYHVKALSECPYPDYVVCGSDGITYGNLCEWILKYLFNPYSRLHDLSLCTLQSDYFPYEELLRALSLKTGNEQFLRSKRKQRKMEKRILIIDRDKDDISTSEGILERLAAIPFIFRRYYQGQENEEFYK